VTTPPVADNDAFGFNNRRWKQLAGIGTFYVSIIDGRRRRLVR
jgi:hypothetical protein